MPTKRCIFCHKAHLDTNTPVHGWPSDSNLGNKWTRFVYHHRPNADIKKSSGICRRHFISTDYHNLAEWKRLQNTKTKSRLKLRDSAIPSVFAEEKGNDVEASSFVPMPLNTEPSNQSTSRVKTEKRQASELLLEEDDCPYKEAKFGSGSGESDDEEQDEDMTDDVPYDPNASFLEYGEQDANETAEFIHNSGIFDDEQPSWREPKFIVPWSFLLWAVSYCRACGEKESVNVERHTRGAMLTINFLCNVCGENYSKSTSPIDEKSNLPVINYLISCAVLFCGGMPRKSYRLLKFIGIACPTPSTFFRHQKKYLSKVIRDVWAEEKAKVAEAARIAKSPLSLAGDSRCDSMGHSAKYGCYSLMDVHQNKILTTRLIQAILNAQLMERQMRTENQGLDIIFQTAGNSNAMEKVGLLQCLEEVMKQMKLKVTNFISDRHIGIRAYMRETYGAERKDTSEPLINHYLDIWHVAKSLKKDLKDAVGKDKDDNPERNATDKHGKLSEWFSSIVNHMYWVAGSTPVGVVAWRETVVAKWTSLLNHVLNIHKHSTAAYPTCSHPRRKRGAKKKKYMKKGTVPYELLTDIINNPKRLKDVKQLSPIGQTSSLEAFHSVINHFAPKMYHFHHRSMNSRIMLAALHFNHNSDIKKQKPESETAYTIIHPKYKKGIATARTRSAESSYDYVNVLIERAMEFREDSHDEVIPLPMAAMYRDENLDKETLIGDFIERKRFPDLN